MSSLNDRQRKSLSHDKWSSCLLISIILSSAAIWNLSNSLTDCSTIKLIVEQTFMSDDNGTINNFCSVVQLLFLPRHVVNQNLSVSCSVLFTLTDYWNYILKCVFSHSNADDLVKVLLKNFIIKEKTPQQLVRVTNGGWFCKYFL